MLSPVELTPQEEQAEFPVVGSRARRWGRFERDLHSWLASPDGRFAAWRAREAVAEPLELSRDSRSSRRRP
jgi:hypothetical protein